MGFGGVGKTKKDTHAQFSFPFSMDMVSIPQFQRHEIHKIKGFASPAEPNERLHKKAQ